MRPCVEKMQGLFVYENLIVYQQKTLCLCGKSVLEVN